MKMVTVQIKQLYKEIKQTGDKFDEQLFNIEEKVSEFQNEQKYNISQGLN